MLHLYVYVFILYIYIHVCVCVHVEPLYGCCFIAIQVSNLIANVTVALALAILLAYSLVGLADHGPGEGIQLAGEQRLGWG